VSQEKERFPKIKAFIKPHLKEKPEESRLDKVNAKLKIIANELAKHLENYSIFVYDHECNVFTP